jgi:hypothetical protein
MSDLYVLDGKVPRAASMREWSAWYKKADRRVALDDVGDTMVSTMFLGVDHNFSSRGAPILFETITKRGAEWGDPERYSTWEEAEKGHAETVARVKAEVEQ